MSALVFSVDPPAPILPATNEGVWGVVPIAFLVLVVLAAVMSARLIIGLRRDARSAARHAAAAEAELRALRRELRGTAD